MVGRVIDFEKARYELSATRELTLDGYHTKDSLKNEIADCVNELAISDTDRIAIYKWIITSFSKTGLIETYNDLGSEKWLKMIRQMIDQEYAIRYINKVSNNRNR